MARMTPRADGRYQKMITVGRKADGSYIRRTVYGRTQKELNGKVAEIAHDVNHGIFVKDDRVTFAEMAELWYEHYKTGISYHTKLLYRKDLDKHLLPVLGGYYLKELKPIHIQGIINSLVEKDYAMWTIKKIKLTACQVLDAAIENDLLSRNVFRKVKVPFKQPTERRALTDEEVALITKFRDHRMSTPALIMLYCGLRRGELLALEWDDVDLDAKLLSVKKAVTFVRNQPEVKEPKTTAGKRDVPIPDMLLDILKEQRTTGLVCPSAKDKMMTDTSFCRAWDSYMNYLNLQAGGKCATRSREKVQVIGHITPHMLRHTYASLLYNAAVDVKSAQRFLGHASLEMTLGTYTHLSKYKEDQSIDALNGYLKK